MEKSSGGLCDRCHQLFNGELVKLAVHSRTKAGQWVVRKPQIHDGAGRRSSRLFSLLPSQHVRKSSVWEAVSLQASHASGSYAVDTPCPMPKDSAFDILYHHGIEEFIVSADGGCPSCRLLLGDRREFATALSDKKRRELRSVPIVKWKPGVDTHANPSGLYHDGSVQIEILFVYESFIGSKVNIETSFQLLMLGPRLPSTTEKSGSIQKPTLDKLRQWLHECPTHKLCFILHDEWGSLFPGLPKRLLHIEHTGFELRIRLIGREDFNKFAGKTQYTTLSHCWGGSEIPGKLEASNYNRYKDGVPVESLPQVFRDAIEVTTSLELNFIWIDALCIIQNSRKDWIDEAPRMGSIYANSTLNIAATASPNCHGSLFVQDSADKSNDIQVNWTSNGPTLGLYRLKGVPSPDSVESLPCPLNERAWVMQEKIFSRREIEFFHDQIQWRCANVSDTDLDTPREQGGSATGFGQIQLTTTPWHQLVTQYLHRDIGRPCDRLVAFSAIAEAVCKTRNASTDEYIAGMWRPHIPSCLLWSVAGMQKSPEKDEDGNYIAPSWSWASIFGPVDRARAWYNVPESLRDQGTWSHIPESHLEQSGRPQWQQSLRVEATVSQVLGASRFGSLDYAYLNVSCLIYPFVISRFADPSCPSSGRQECWIGNGGRWKEICRYCPDSSLGDSHVAPFLANFLPMTLRRLNSVIEGLILVAVPENKTTFKRVGLLSISISESAPEWWGNNPNMNDTRDNAVTDAYKANIRIV